MSEPNEKESASEPLKVEVPERNRSAKIDVPFSMVNFQKFQLPKDGNTVYETMILKKERHGLKSKYMKFYVKFHNDCSIHFFDPNIVNVIAGSPTSPTPSSSQQQNQYVQSMKRPLYVFNFKDAKFSGKINKNSQKLGFKIKVLPNMKHNRKKSTPKTIRMCAQNQMEYSEWIRVFQNSGMKKKKKKNPSHSIRDRPSSFGGGNNDVEDSLKKSKKGRSQSVKSEIGRKRSHSSAAASKNEHLSPRKRSQSDKKTKKQQQQEKQQHDLSMLKVLSDENIHELEKKYEEHQRKENAKYLKTAQHQRYRSHSDSSSSEGPGMDFPLTSFTQFPFIFKLVSEWSHNDVLDWSKIHYLTKDFKTFYEVAGDKLKTMKQVNGKFLLLSLSDQKKLISFLVSLGITNYHDRLLFKKNLEIMKKGKYFFIGRHVAIEKSIALHHKHNMETSLKDQMVWTQKKKDLFDLKSCQLKLNKLYGIDQQKKEEKEEDNEESSEEEEGEGEGLNKEEEESLYKFRIKLIITENIRDQKMKKLRSLFGVGLKVAPISLDSIHFGFFHVALAIGPLQFDWNDSGFVHVRKTYSANVILCLDIDDLTIEEMQLKEFTKDLSKRILYWNVNQKYDSVKSNCQHFVLDMLKYMGREEYKFGSHTQKFLDRMKFKGEFQMKFEFDTKFQKTFSDVLKETEKEGEGEGGEQEHTGLDVKNTTFYPKNHNDIDTFLLQLLKVCPSFQTEYSSEYELLKGFDRAFWMRHFRNQQDQNTIQSKEGCPFSWTKQQQIKFGKKWKNKQN